MQLRRRSTSHRHQTARLYTWSNPVKMTAPASIALRFKSIQNCRWTALRLQTHPTRTVTAPRRLLKLPSGCSWVYFSAATAA